MAGALTRGAAQCPQPLELSTVGGHRLGQFVAGGRMVVVVQLGPVRKDPWDGPSWV